MSRRFVVRTGDAASVADVLARLAVPASAVHEGRVFLGRRRVREAAEAVRAGDEVVVHEPSTEQGGVELLSEWRNLHAVLKPPGLPTEPDRQGRTSLIQIVADRLRVPTSALHAATRLDAPVSGIVVVAQGAEASRLVAALKEAGQLRRRYVGLAGRGLEPARGTWEMPIGRSRGRAAAFAKDAQAAQTRYRFVASVASAALLVAEPVTGRTHQIRIHAAEAGAALLGDVAHGGPRRIVKPDGNVVTLERVALHAARIEVALGGAAEWSVVAPAPSDLVSIWTDLGGDREAFDAAVGLPALDAP